MGNSNLINAKRVKNDEFYTQYETIEEELIHYKKHFEGKTVYCNCDDPRWSNFFKYFVDNFHELKLKRLIASCYVDQSYNLFTINDKREPTVWADYNGWLVDGRAPDVSEIEVKELKGDGDFRSEESIELLKQADIVVTNPPFSLFREFVPLLMDYDKKFLVIGNCNAITYKCIFPLIKERRIWQGVKKGGSMEFSVPSYTEFYSQNAGRIDMDGNKYLSLVNACWWTNLDYEEAQKDIELTEVYEGNEENYPKYDNYDAINVNKVADIPCDYSGAMGVPITFIGYWNPEQFEVLGITKSWDNNGLYNGQLKTKDAVVNGRKTFTRLFIQNKRLNPDIYGGEQS